MKNYAWSTWSAWCFSRYWEKGNYGYGRKHRADRAFMLADQEAHNRRALAGILALRCTWLARCRMTLRPLLRFLLLPATLGLKAWLAVRGQRSIQVGLCRLGENIRCDRLGRGMPVRRLSLLFSCLLIGRVMFGG